MLTPNRGLKVFAVFLSVGGFSWAAANALQQEQRLPSLVKDSESMTLQGTLEPMQVLRQHRRQVLQTILASLPSYKQAKDPDKYCLYLLDQKYRQLPMHLSSHYLPLQTLLNDIQAAPDKETLFHILSKAAARGRPNPFLQLRVAPGLKINRYQLYILGPDLSLRVGNQPWRNQALLTDRKNKIERWFNNVQIDNLDKDKVATWVAWEEHLSQFLPPEQGPIGQEDRVKSLDLKTLPQNIRQQMPANIQSKGPFLVIGEDTLAAYGHFLEKAPLEELKSYALYFYQLFYAPYRSRQERLLIDPLVPEGTGEYSFLKRYGRPSFGRLYQQKTLLTIDKGKIIALTNQMKTVLLTRLQDNTWLRAESKKRLQEKILALRVEVGAPAGKAEIVPSLSKKSLIETVSFLDERRWQAAIALLGTQVNRSAWITGGESLNAYYDTLRNSVFYPAAILSYPFSITREDKGTYYGSLGTLIAHEMSHALDAHGFNYDKWGNFNPLSAKDRISFAKRARQVNHRYQQYGDAIGKKINSERTLNENLADYTGVRIALIALNKDGQANRERNQRFFTSWLSLFLQKHSVKENHDTYIHSPDRVRAIAPLLDLKEFEEVFFTTIEDRRYRRFEEKPILW